MASRTTIDIQVTVEGMKPMYGIREAMAEYAEMKAREIAEAANETVR